MSTGYSWEGIRQVCATLLGACHVPKRLCGGCVYLGRYIKCSTFTFTKRQDCMLYLDGAVVCNQLVLHVIIPQSELSQVLQ